MPGGGWGQDGEVRVTVVPYDLSWPVLFETIRQHLEAALTGVPYEGIEHVGSTSVPGLAAKPILDIDVVVRREALDAAIDALVAVGYTHEGDKGVPDRHFLRPSAHDELAGVPRHVYVCVDGALSLRNHLAVRDTLRARADLREAYGAVKLALAERDLDGIEDYIDGKNDIVQRILAASGVSTDDLGRILTINQKSG